MLNNRSPQMVKCGNPLFKKSEHRTFPGFHTLSIYVSTSKSAMIPFLSMKSLFSTIQLDGNGRSGVYIYTFLLTQYYLNNLGASSEAWAEVVVCACCCCCSRAGPLCSSWYIPQIGRVQGTARLGIDAIPLFFYPIMLYRM